MKTSPIFLLPTCLLAGVIHHFLLFFVISAVHGFQVGQHPTSRHTYKSTPTTMMMSSAPPSTTTTGSKSRMLNGIRDLVNHYDIFLLDMWGVMHDGTTTYEGVLDVISKLKEAGKELIILSNSSKRQDNSLKMLKKLGFDPTNDFAEIITSGEVSYHMLAQTKPSESTLAPQPWDRLESISAGKSSEKKVFCFGSGAGDEEYITSAGWTLAEIDDADLIVARGTFTIIGGGSGDDDDKKTLIDKTKDGEEVYFEAYHKIIAKAAERKIPMIVANPDKIRPDADRSPMPGTIGKAYKEALGGDSDGLIKYIGKPFGDVYEIALRNRERTRACMIGDALETDIVGGTIEGIDTIWVIKDGIHIDAIESRGYDTLEEGCNAILEDFNKLDDTYAEGRQLSPTITLPHFRW